MPFYPFSHLQFGWRSTALSINPALPVEDYYKDYSSTVNSRVNVHLYRLKLQYMALRVVDGIEHT